MPVFDCPVCGHKTNMPQTNADRIRAMSDEELSTLLCDISDCSTCRWGQYAGCVVKEWLKQPAPEPPKEESRQDCTYNKNGHCIGQKLMPECDPKACDRRGAK